MRKFFAIPLLLFLLILAACQTQDTDVSSLTVLSSDSVSGSSDEPAITEPAKINLEEIIPEEGYSYGNMHKNVPSGNFMMIDNLVYFTDSYVELYTYNTRTGEITPSCKDATCKHRPEDCNYKLGLSNIELYHGKLYAIDFGDNIYGEIDGNQFHELIKGVSEFWHADSNLYVISADGALLVYEDGSQKPRMITDELHGIWCSTFGHYLYYQDDNCVYWADLSAETFTPQLLIENARYTTDGKFIYYVTCDTNNLYRCKMNGSEPTLLTDMDVIFSSVNLDDEYFYFTLVKTVDSPLDDPDIYKVFRFPLDHPEQLEVIAELPYPAYQVFTVPGLDKIFVSTNPPDRVDEFGNYLGLYYAMNKDGNDPQPMEIPEY